MTATLEQLSKNSIAANRCARLASLHEPRIGPLANTFDFTVRAVSVTCRAGQKNLRELSFSTMGE